MANVPLRIKGKCTLVAERSQLTYMGSSLKGWAMVASVVVFGAGENEPSKVFG